MGLPSMTSVFIVEASMHAWKNLGTSPELKAQLESMFGEIAYDVAIVMRPVINDAMFHDGLSDKQAYNELLFPEDPEFRDPWAERMLAAVRRSAPLRKALRTNSAKIIKMGAENGIEYLNALVSQHAGKAPEAYEDAEVFLELDDGWKWVQVSDAECKEYEGSLMQHCGKSEAPMYSLRDTSGKPHVTAEYDHYDNSITQLKGKQNNVVDEKYWDACGDLLKHITKLADGKKPIFEDPIYTRTKAGTDFLDYLNEFGFARTGWNKELMNPISFDDDVHPEDEGPFGRNF